MLARDAVRGGYRVRCWEVLGCVRRTDDRRRLTAHEPEVEREDSVILGEDIWRDDDVQWARWFVVQV